jgi:hypothetical protein
MTERMLNKREQEELQRLRDWMLQRRVIVVRTIQALRAMALIGPAGLVVLATQMPRQWAVCLLAAATVLLVALAAGAVAMVRWGRRSEEDFLWRSNVLRRMPKAKG